MICLISGNYEEARIFARAQNLDDDSWFFPTDPDDLLCRKDFHVLVIGTAGMNTPASYFNKIYDLALQRGRMK